MHAEGRRQKAGGGGGGGGEGEGIPDVLGKENEMHDCTTDHDKNKAMSSRGNEQQRR